MSIVQDTARILYELTKEKPMFLHMDAIGFLNFGENIGKDIKEIINNKLKLFNDALILAEDMGANILIPTFSYSTNEPYNVVNSPSEVGAATDFFRKMNPDRRTKDPLFSYILFSKDDDLRDDLNIKNFDTFGEKSIIDKVFQRDGFIGSIGNVLWHPTEAHYLEKKLNVKYRYDKKFECVVIDGDNKKHKIETIFFCRDLDINMIADFKPLEKDMYDKYIVKKVEISNFFIEYISMKEMFELMKNKLNENKFYFCRENKKEYKINV